MLALGRNRRLRLVDEVLDQGLLFQRVDKLQGRDAMLRFDQAPAPSLIGPGLRR